MDVLKITPDMAAAIIGKHSQFIRIGVQRGLLTYHGEPIGTAIRKTPKSKYNYYINPKLFALYAGLTMDELRRAVAEMKGEAA